jgi:hypothetical protein
LLAVAFSPGGDGGRNFRRNPHTSFAAASDCEGTRFYESRPKISGRRDAADRSDIGADRVVEATMLQTLLAAWARSIILSARSTSPAQDIGLMEISQRVAPLLRKFNLRH